MACARRRCEVPLTKPWSPSYATAARRNRIRELILTSAGITAAFCEDLQIPLRYAGGTDKLAIDRMLWKLGFNPMQFDDSIPRFKTRLAEFNETILASTPIDTEDAREHVRAAGVNVFVLLEDFADRLISLYMLASASRPTIS